MAGHRLVNHLNSKWLGPLAVRLAITEALLDGRFGFTIAHYFSRNLMCPIALRLP